MSDADLGALVQGVAEAHLELCFRAEEDDECVSPACAPFCGCLTCIVREVLFASWDLIAGAVTLKIEASQGNAVDLPERGDTASPPQQ